MLDELRTDLADLSAAHEAELAQARDWARRAEIAREAGRRDLAFTAEQRREQQARTAAALANEVAQFQAMLAETSGPVDGPPGRK